MSKKKKDEECSACDLAVALGTTIRVCKRLGHKKKCKELFNKVIDGEIGPEEVFKTVRKMAKGHKEELEELDMVDEFLEEVGYGKNKGKKKGKPR